MAGGGARMYAIIHGTNVASERKRRRRGWKKKKWKKKCLSSSSSVLSVFLARHRDGLEEEGERKGGERDFLPLHTSFLLKR